MYWQDQEIEGSKHHWETSWRQEQGRVYLVKSFPNRGVLTARIWGGQYKDSSEIGNLAFGGGMTFIQGSGFKQNSHAGNLGIN